MGQGYNKKQCANDAVPVSAIRLLEAFQMLTSRLVCIPLEDLPIQDVLENVASQSVRTASAIDPVSDKVAVDRVMAEIPAAWIFRQALTDGDLIALVRDPKAGETLRLNSEEWSLCDGRDEFFEMQPIYDDFVFGPLDRHSPGPDGTFLDGKFRPVFLDRAHFVSWLERLGEFAKPRHSGNFHTSGVGTVNGWNIADDLLCDEMDKLIHSGEARSANDAARMVAPKAKGNGSPESKARRLRGRLRERSRQQVSADSS